MLYFAKSLRTRSNYAHSIVADFTLVKDSKVKAQRLDFVIRRSERSKPEMNKQSEFLRLTTD